LQRRVLGVLIEKAKTTPAAYPMTLLAITTGCNQKNNRDPVMSLDADDVERVLSELCAMSVASEVDGVGRVTKYRHHGYDWLGVNRAELAVLAELLLRGEQTLGDLRARAARMEPIADLAALRPIVDSLLGKGLMVELSPAGRGQMVSHHLYWPRELAELRARYGASAGEGVVPRAAREGDRAGSAETAAPAPASVRPPAPAPPDALAAEVADLRAEVARLRARLRELESRLPGPAD
jgi:hypothetical protein